MKIDVLGIKIDALTKEELLHKLKNLLILDKPIFITTPYSESLVAAQKDQEFKNILNSADFALPDGIGILWAAHFLEYRISNLEYRIKIFFKLIISLLAIILNPKSIRNPIPEKISGAEFIWDLAELAGQKNYSIFLLGGFGDTPSLAADALKNKFPNLRIAGTYAPPRDVILEGPPKADPDRIPKDSIAALQNDIIGQINSSNTDFLFVALGPGRQEKWIAKNLSNLKIKLAIGLGGTFDYLAQKRPYRPKFWATTGLEWAFRLLTQPWRVVRILKGVGGLIYHTVRAKMVRSKTSGGDKLYRSGY